MEKVAGDRGELTALDTMMRPLNLSAKASSMERALRPVSISNVSSSLDDSAAVLGFSNEKPTGCCHRLLMLRWSVGQIEKRAATKVNRYNNTSCLLD